MTQESLSKFPSPIEIVNMTVLGLISLAGIIGMLITFIPSSQPGESNLVLAPACLGMIFAGITSILMIWLRKRNT